MTKKILIVEDYDDTLAFMKLLIERFGYKVLTAANNNEAVEIARQEIPDLILMDIALPDMKGLAITEILRQSFDSSKMPIVAITAHGDVILSKLIKAGCNEIINKPVKFDSLESILSKFLKR